MYFKLVQKLKSLNLVLLDPSMNIKFQINKFNFPIIGNFKKLDSNTNLLVKNLTD